MKGFRFYAEMPCYRGSKSACKKFPHDPWTVARLTEKAKDGFRCAVLAVHLDEHDRPLLAGDGTLECMSQAIDGNPFSYCVTGADDEYVRKRCTRISEALARKLSPELFKRLED